eukprot:COSAG02_NODE_168_length_31711_cov_68.337973_6_plen_50_part_00
MGVRLSGVALAAAGGDGHGVAGGGVAGSAELRMSRARRTYSSPRATTSD